MHALIQVQVQLWKLELPLQIGSTILKRKTWIIFILQSGRRARHIYSHVIEHIHCALGHRLIHDGSVLLLRLVLLAFLGAPLNRRERAIRIPWRRQALITGFVIGDIGLRQ